VSLRVRFVLMWTDWKGLIGDDGGQDWARYQFGTEDVTARGHIRVMNDEIYGHLQTSLGLWPSEHRIEIR
jgi:hypothetical protein